MSDTGINTVIGVLSGMITPAILILATGSLLLTTSQRLSRSLDRSRKLLAEWVSSHSGSELRPAERSFLIEQLKAAVRRSRLLQISMSCLYLALALLIATSAELGMVEVYRVLPDWLPVLTGLLAVILLFVASFFLILESRISFRAVNQEMDDVMSRIG